MITLLQHPWIATFLAFLLGAVVGSFLNVCIARLPLEKSIFWPSSRCLTCLQPIRWLDNFPLISYWRLNGNCRSCGASFSSRYFWIELLTGLAFAGLYWLEVVENYRRIPAATNSPELLVTWIYHAIFLSLLLIVTFTDFDTGEIPFGVTKWGTVLGLLGGMLFPWPWPMANTDWIEWRANILLPVGLQPWPFWSPAMSWPEPGTWSMGLMNGVVGALFGTGMIRLIRWIFGWAFEKEAMGLGDADIMMMIGAFLGWQSFFFVMGSAVFLALGYALYLLITSRTNELPFGPFLAGGAMLTLLFFDRIALYSQLFFFDLPALLAMAILSGMMVLFMSVAIRMLRLIRQAA
jgi:leader peptidase (prepilin peptidase)/N-methyltransferase